MTSIGLGDFNASYIYYSTGRYEEKVKGLVTGALKKKGVMFLRQKDRLGIN